MFLDEVHEAVHGFGEAVKQAGKSTQEKQGMWANSNFDDLVQYNDGFRTGLIGTPDQIAERIVALKDLGVNFLRVRMIPVPPKKTWPSTSPSKRLFSTPN